MKLDTVDLPGATFSIAETKKLTVYEYLWTDRNAVEESGAGPTTINVVGLFKTRAGRDALQATCQANGTKKLYFASQIGETDDRYFIVYTQPLQLAPASKSATVYTYSFTAIAADTHVYDADTDLAVW